MADRMKASVSMSPIVTITGDVDADDLDVIHHDIKQTLGGKLSWTAGQFLVGTSRWYYSAATTVTTTHADLIGGFSSPTTYTDGTAIDASADFIRLIYIEHLGIDGNGDASAATDYLGINVIQASSASYYCLMLEPAKA